MSLLAYHNDPIIKTDILAQLARHREHDEIVKGRYWDHGKGCAVGCTLHSSNHAEYETRFGIPQMLAHLEDTLFEGMPNADAKQWPERFMGAIQPGKDLSRVGWKFLHWLLTDPTINPGIEDERVRDAVCQCAGVLVPLTKGKPVARAAARSAARSAAEAAAWAAAWAAWAAARSAARSAAEAAWAAAAAWAAEAAGAASSEAYLRMSNKLVELLEAA